MPSKPTHCADFTRAGLLRSGLAAAAAGRGLPALEPGTPAPAGTGLSRRSFMARSGGLALAVFGGAALSPQVFEEGIASAAAAAPGERVLVSVALTGGFDGLSLLAPVEDPRFRTARPTLGMRTGQTAGAYADDPRLHWHSNAAPLKDLHAAGKLMVMPAIGYASANQSHFTGRHFWEIGATDPAARVGWMGRYLDLYGQADNPLQGLSLSANLSPSLAPATVPVAAVSEPQSFGLRVRDVPDARWLQACGTGWRR